MSEIICFKQPFRMSIIEVLEGELSLQLIKQHIGNSDGMSFMECVYNVIPSMQSVVLVCAEDGKLRGLRITLILEGDDIAGDCFLCKRAINKYGEGILVGLDSEQRIEIFSKFFLERGK
ncbi:hypothetical protein [Scytonema sp. NUACC26]|uniref:hypothetical protein n=1 Tax=Scytonema sp. NUACC26 TaxID=3140176 RepID=UPI0034DCB19F